MVDHQGYTAGVHLLTGRGTLTIISSSASEKQVHLLILSLLIAKRLVLLTSEVHCAQTQSYGIHAAIEAGRDVAGMPLRS